MHPNPFDKGSDFSKVRFQTFCAIGTPGKMTKYRSSTPNTDEANRECISKDAPVVEDENKDIKDNIKD